MPLTAVLEGTEYNLDSLTCYVRLSYPGISDKLMPYKFRFAEQLTPQTIKEFILGEKNRLEPFLERASVLQSMVGIECFQILTGHPDDIFSATLDSVIFNFDMATVNIGITHKETGRSTVKTLNFNSSDDMDAGTLLSLLMTELNRLASIQEKVGLVNMLRGADLIAWSNQ